MLFFIVPFLVASYPEKKIDNQDFIEPESVFVSAEQDNHILKWRQGEGENDRISPRAKTHRKDQKFVKFGIDIDEI
jgi:hypothetical protein